MFLLKNLHMGNNFFFFPIGKYLLIAVVGQVVELSQRPSWQLRIIFPLQYIPFPPPTPYVLKYGNLE